MQTNNNVVKIMRSPSKAPKQPYKATEQKAPSQKQAPVFKRVMQGFTAFELLAGVPSYLGYQ